MFFPTAQQARLTVCLVLSFNAECLVGKLRVLIFKSLVDSTRNQTHSLPIQKQTLYPLGRPVGSSLAMLSIES